MLYEKLKQKMFEIDKELESEVNQGYAICEIHETQSNGLVRLKGRKGRYLNLEDVLRVIDKKFTDSVNDNIHLDWRNNWTKDGCIKITKALGHPMLNIEVEYQLGKPLHLQSEETINGLIDLIK